MGAPWPVSPAIVSLLTHNTPGSKIIFSKNKSVIGEIKGEIGVVGYKTIAGA